MTVQGLSTCRSSSVAVTLLLQIIVVLACTCENGVQAEVLVSCSNTSLVVNEVQFPVGGDNTILMTACEVPLTVMILRSNVSLRLVNCAIRYISLGNASTTNATFALDRVSVVLDGAVATNDPVDTPTTMPLIKVAGIILTNCKLLLTHCRVSMVGLGIMIDVPAESSLYSIEIIIDHSRVQLTAASGDAIGVRLHGYRTQRTTVRIQHSTFDIIFPPFMWGNLVSMRPWTTATRLGVFDAISVEATNVTASIHASGGASKMYGIVIDDIAPQNALHPDGTNVTVAMTDVNFNASASVHVVFLLHAGLNRVFDLHISMQRVVLTATIVGEMLITSTSRSATAIELATEVGGFHNLTLYLHNVRMQSYLPFGKESNDPGAEFQSVESVVVKVYGLTNSTIVVRNASIRCQGMEAPQTITSILSQAAVSVVVVMDNTTNANVSVTQSSVWVSQPRYCPHYRTLLNASLGSTPLLLQSNGGIYTLYVAPMSISRTTMVDSNVFVAHNSVCLHNFPNRTDCPGPIYTTATPSPFLSADVPLLFSVTLGALGIIGEEPLLLRHNGFANPQIFDNLLGKMQERYRVSMHNVALTVVGNVISSRRLVSVSEPTLGTLFRLGHVAVIGVHTLHDISFSVVNEIAPATVATADLNPNSLYTHPPLAFVDALGTATGVQLNVSHEVMAPTEEGGALTSSVLWEQQDPALSINDSTWSSSSIVVGPLGNLRGKRPRLALVVVNITDFHDNTQLIVDRSALSGYDAVTHGGGNRFPQGSTAPNLITHCVQWEGRALRHTDALGPAFPAASVSLGYDDEVCPRPATTHTTTKGRETPHDANQGGPLLNSGTRGIAAMGIATGGLVSTAAVVSMQRSIALLRLSKCDGVDGMYDALDVFTNPVRLTISAGASSLQSDASSGTDDDDGGTVPFGAAYRGAIVGNVCVLWCGGIALALCGSLLLRWKQGPLWRMRESAAVLRLPGNLYPLLAAPLLQPVLSCGIALLLHGRVTADWALGVLGVVASVAVVGGACAVVSPWWFMAASTRAPYVRETSMALTAVRAESGGGVVRRAQRMAKAAWLRVVLALFVAEREWMPRRRQDHLFVSSLGGVFEALRDRRQWTVVVEMAVVVATSVTAAVLPEEEAECRGVATADAVINVLLVLFYVLLRPYETRYDQLTAISTAAMTSVLAVMVAAGSNDDDAEAAAEAVNVLSSVVLLLGVVQCATGAILLRRRFALLWKLLGLFQQPRTSDASRCFADLLNTSRSKKGASMPRSNKVPGRDIVDVSRLEQLEDLSRLSPAMELNQQSNLSMVIAMICELRAK